MNRLEDAEVESKIRQELYHGNVTHAKEWLRQIRDSTLQSYLREVIYDYEGERNECS
jgi:hypothetical protein